MVSPWTYFGHDRFVAIAARHGATIAVKPIDLGKVFPVSGGLPLPKRAPQRQAYRLVELARWRDHLGIPLNLQPKFAAASGDPRRKWILAAARDGASGPRSISPARSCARAGPRSATSRTRRRSRRSPARLGQDAAALAARAAAPEIAARFEACTQEAIDRQVFGAPTYVYRDELFWGQDRLDFLDRKLAQ